MTDQTPSGPIRSEADAIRAASALIEAVRRGSPDAPALLERVVM